ncbi:MAG: ABC transporter ATP-binding protein [Candidatus Limnocylindrales bacterium]
MAIRAVGLTKRYGRTTALDGLDLDVPRGETFGFLGPNGAGKTTAVKLLLGLAYPASGTGWVLGAPLGDRSARARIGYLPELFRYQPWLTAREVLALHCSLARIERSDWASAIRSALLTVGLADRADDRVGGFSKGMQQRLGLGVALLGPPDLVILDEPTSALDPVGRQDVRQIIHGLREHGVTVFLNSHLLGEVERVCDRVAVVDRGRVVATGALPGLLSSRSVLLRATDLPDEVLPSLGRFGHVHRDGDRLTVEGIEPDAIPDLVAEAVRLGGRIQAVEPLQQTLEDRFLALVGAERG